MFLKTGPQAYDFVKKRFQYRFFPVTFAKFLRAPLLWTRIVGFLRSVNGSKDKNPSFFKILHSSFLLHGFSLTFLRFPRKSKNRLNTSLPLYRTPPVAASGMILKPMIWWNFIYLLILTSFQFELHMIIINLAKVHYLIYCVHEKNPKIKRLIQHIKSYLFISLFSNNRN